MTAHSTLKTTVSLDTHRNMAQPAPHKATKPTASGTPNPVRRGAHVQIDGLQHRYPYYATPSLKRFLMAYF